MAYAYIYATPSSPDYHAQHFAILSFASNNRLGQVNFIHEVPDRLHGARPILAGMLDNLQREDVLLVADFNSLGSSTVEVLGILSTLSRTGVKLYVVNSGYRLADNMQSQVVALACSLVQQLELELVSSRTTVASVQKQPDVATVVGSDRRTRRSKLDDRRSEIEELLSNGISMPEAARRLGVSRPTLTDWVYSRNLSVQNQPATT